MANFFFPSSFSDLTQPLVSLVQQAEMFISINIFNNLNQLFVSTTVCKISLHYKEVFDQTIWT